ncbi:hypothetical protein NFI96_018445 [Prochilodus magdalenae]|nr:hypothetical protein NFI96_018445 [Prochilodus magdalenae]
MATEKITTLPPADGGSSGFPPGNFKEPKRLYCKNGGYFLRINPDGRVDGIREKNDPNIRLQLQAISVGEVVIKGLSANRYLAMSSDGRLYGTDPCLLRNAPCTPKETESPQERSLHSKEPESPQERPLHSKGPKSPQESPLHSKGPGSPQERRATEECHFLERLEANNYNTYRSRKYPDWYVALKRTGQYKSGSKTGPGQKAILFLPMSAKG